jgi:hypothetical protein
VAPELALDAEMVRRDLVHELMQEEAHARGECRNNDERRKADELELAELAVAEEDGKCYCRRKPCLDEVNDLKL